MRRLLPSFVLLFALTGCSALGGAAGLTDGRRAGVASIRDPRWHGLEGPDLEAIVDLEESIAVNRLSMSFLQDAAMGVFAPPTVEYAVSEDGRTWKADWVSCGWLEGSDPPPIDILKANPVPLLFKKIDVK